MLTAFATEYNQTLSSFEKIIVSPHIRLELVQGEEEHITFETYGVKQDEFIAEVRGNTLHLYLEDAKIWDDDYGMLVKAKVTYRALKRLEVRGEEKVICHDAIEADKFVLKVYGESSVRLSSVQASRMKVALFGENDVRIESGNVSKQVYKSFGENVLEADGVSGRFTKTKTYGESELNVYASEKIRVNAFGESDVRYAGNGRVSRGLIFGENSIRAVR